ncbi:MAG: toxin-antitoxin system YwqK family antitoxin [Planctomycetota bacterium]
MLAFVRWSSPRSLGLLATVLLLAAAQVGIAQNANSSRRESVEIEPYTGPPIYLPEGEEPPPASVVESRTVKENFPDTDTLRFERRVTLFSDNSVVSDGPHKEYHSNGELYVDGAYDRGKATGKWVYHHPNGQVAKEVTYSDGKPNGKVEMRNEEGKVIAVREYDDGVRVGTWTSFDETGEQKLREESYANGKANGTFRIWYSNGQLRQEINFKDGEREGVATEWSRVGDKRAEITFKDNLKDGPATVWQRDGTVLKQTYAAGELVTTNDG